MIATTTLDVGLPEVNPIKGDTDDLEVTGFREHLAIPQRDFDGRFFGGIQPRTKDDLHPIWLAGIRAAAHQAFDRFRAKYE